MRRYDAVVFDLDGTLLDTSEGIGRSVAYVIKTMKYPEVSDEVMRTFIGPPIQRSFARVFGLDQDEANAAADMFRARYKESDILLARPYDGIFDTIRSLSKAGVRSAVATYKRQDYAEKILVHFGFDKVCDVICGSDLEGKLTKKDIIVNAIRKLGVSDKSRAVMVGDSDNDAIGAAECGVDFIAATYGFGFASAEDADEFSNIGAADTPDGILRYIL